MPIRSRSSHGPSPIRSSSRVRCEENAPTSRFSLPSLAFPPSEARAFFAFVFSLQGGAVLLRGALQARRLAGHRGTSQGRCSPRTAEHLPPPPPPLAAAACRLPQGRRRILIIPCTGLAVLPACRSRRSRRGRSLARCSSRPTSSIKHTQSVRVEVRTRSGDEGPLGSEGPV